MNFLFIKAFQTDYILGQYFEICSLIPERINNPKVINFTNLSQNTKHIFYLIPVLNQDSIGNLAKLFVETKLAGIDINYIFRNKLE